MAVVPDSATLRQVALALFQAQSVQTPEHSWLSLNKRDVLCLGDLCPGDIVHVMTTQPPPHPATPSSSAAAAASSGSPTVEYQDHFLGKVSVITVAQRHQLDATLIFVKAWLRFSRGRRAALGTALPQPPPPVDHTQFALWPAQRVRGMPELTATACHRLSTAPASLNVNFRVASGWTTLILDRVVSGYINKIQVQLLL